MSLVNTFYISIGWAWCLAVFIDLLAVMAEGGSKRTGKAAEGEDQPESGGIAHTIMMVLSSLATAALFIHAVYASALAVFPVLKFVAMGIVLVVVLGGSMLGQGIASVSEGFRRFCATIQLPLGLVAVGVTLFATYPSLVLFFKMVERFFSPAPSEF